MIDFWVIIGSNLERDSDEIDSALEEVSGRLGSMSPDALIRFAKQLDEALFRIDRRDFADVPVKLANGLQVPQTSDHFLYALCACVLAGEKVYGGILDSRRGFDRFVAPFMQRAEGLLYIASELHESKTGARMKIDSDFSTDWMSNAQGWSE